MSIEKETSLKVYFDKLDLLKWKLHAQINLRSMIGKYYMDKDGKYVQISDITTTSIEVFIPKKSDAGIDAKNWFTNKDFNNRFS